MPFRSKAAPDGGTRRPRILIVEDEEETRTLVVRALDKARYETFQAGDGIEALEQLDRLSRDNDQIRPGSAEDPEPTSSTAPVDAVLTDIQMPRLRGDALFRLIRARYPDTAILLFSAYTDIELAISCLRDGASDYIPKPFNISDLIVRLNRALDQERLLRLQRRQAQALELATAEREEQARLLVWYALRAFPLMQDASGTEAARTGGSARLRLWVQRLQQAVWPEDALLARCLETTLNLYHLQRHLGASREAAEIPATLIKDWPTLRDSLSALRHCTEFWDGSGAPDSLKGEDIPRGARLIALVFEWNALLTQGMSEEQALVTLRAAATTRWDPQLVAALPLLFSK